jgi:hypothetical protein
VDLGFVLAAVAIARSGRCKRCVAPVRFKIQPVVFTPGSAFQLKWPWSVTQLVRKGLPFSSSALCLFALLQLATNWPWLCSISLVIKDGRR